MIAEFLDESPPCERSRAAPQILEPDPFPDSYRQPDDAAVKSAQGAATTVPREAEVRAAVRHAASIALGGNGVQHARPDVVFRARLGSQARLRETPSCPEPSKADQPYGACSGPQSRFGVTSTVHRFRRAQAVLQAWDESRKPFLLLFEDIPPRCIMGRRNECRLRIICGLPCRSMDWSLTIVDPKEIPLPGALGHGAARRCSCRTRNGRTSRVDLIKS